MLELGPNSNWDYVDGGYSVTVSTRVCGTLSSGSNPDSHTKRDKPDLTVWFESEGLCESYYSPRPKARW